MDPIVIARLEAQDYLKRLRGKAESGSGGSRIRVLRLRRKNALAHERLRLIGDANALDAGPAALRSGPVFALVRRSRRIYKGRAMALTPLRANE